MSDGRVTADFTREWGIRLHIPGVGWVGVDARAADLLRDDLARAMDAWADRMAEEEADHE